MWHIEMKHRGDPNGDEDRSIRQVIQIWNDTHDWQVNDWASGYDFTTGRRDLTIGDFQTEDDAHEFTEAVKAACGEAVEIVDVHDRYTAEDN